MTNEEKLKRLINLAVEKGWNYFGLFDGEPFDVTLSFDEVIINWWSGCHKGIPLNDLILDWNRQETPFIEALCSYDTFKTNTNTIISGGQYNEKLYYPVKNIAQYFQFEWVSLPTSERLEYLLETFKTIL